ncbi:SH3 domain-containing protein [Sediminibacillus dalangtanensis]|uniref:SH3 domain-containing protein n=1 Tax=Sediminibacillus dalangtanensis TaxID=2729421 RepID=A0ABX7VYD5_9BACI|nr:SH3 domain-containing protein [Sediminibacillus dalangtanensis]QTN00811.1 SH3 domain-containing protein [Sediminibacillus dalangtanensis]
MKKLIKISAYMLGFLVCAHFFPSFVSAAPGDNLQGIGIQDSTPVYAKTSTSSTVLKSYERGTLLRYSTYNTSWYKATVYIRGEATTGYIRKRDVETAVSPQRSLQGIGKANTTNVYALASDSSKVLKSYSKGTILKYKTLTSNWYQATVYLNGRATTGYIYASDVENADNSPANLLGVSLTDPVKVYQQAIETSDVLKSYGQGTVLKYKTFTSGWYKATVYVRGKAKTGYISKKQVENADPEPTEIVGVGLKSSTKVYDSPNSNSNTLKAYRNGTVLQYRTFTSKWYQATVYVNGKARTGYISKSDVEDGEASPSVLEGIGVYSSTSVYAQASTDSKQLKSYKQGTILQYETFTSNWYKAKVYLNGQARTGYIYKNDVENGASSPVSLEGVGLKSKTNVYAAATSSSAVLKSYQQGTILNYQTFTSSWYRATVYVDGKAKTGYIAKNDVENADDQPNTLNGIAAKAPTNVYTSPVGSKTVKSYKQGSSLKYQTYTTGWYQATVYVDGKKQTGYIKNSDVENLEAVPEQLQGYGAKSPTNVYANPSTSASVLKSYSHGSELKYKTYTASWYQATVYVNGKARTGYIHKNDVSDTPQTVYQTTKYDHTFSQAADIQMTRTPKANGSGTIPATRSQVEYYMNPDNFAKDASSYFQFLKLSHSAQLSANEINSKVLNNKGTLTGTADAFIEAGEKFNINEVYLMAHALHETNNGKSALAAGVGVDAKGNVVGSGKTPAYTVYNMYGYGAYDGCALSCGAKYAFDHNWFTPEAAVIGGAEDVTKNYINKGQDTLYKMRWNPANPGVHQYATHVSWAVSQTTKISDIYSLLDKYVLSYDIPQYRNQPEPGTISELPAGIYGVTTTRLNFRTEPNSSSSVTIISTLDNGQKVEVLGSNGNGWYQVKVGSQTGWVSSSYVDLLNLLEVTASSLNVRTEPSTNGSPVGGLRNGTLVAGMLDKSDHLVKDGVWYQIDYNGSAHWVSGGNDGGYISEK